MWAPLDKNARFVCHIVEPESDQEEAFAINKAHHGRSEVVVPKAWRDAGGVCVFLRSGPCSGGGRGATIILEDVGGKDLRPTSACCLPVSFDAECFLKSAKGPTPRNRLAGYRAVVHPSQQQSGRGPYLTEGIAGVAGGTEGNGVPENLEWDDLARNCGGDRDTVEYGGVAVSVRPGKAT